MVTVYSMHLIEIKSGKVSCIMYEYWKICPENCPLVNYYIVDFEIRSIYVLGTNIF